MLVPPSPLEILESSKMKTIKYPKTITLNKKNNQIKNDEIKLFVNSRKFVVKMITNKIYVAIGSSDESMLQTLHNFYHAPYKNQINNTLYSQNKDWF